MRVYLVSRQSYYNIFLQYFRRQDDKMNANESERYMRQNKAQAKRLKRQRRYTKKLKQSQRKELRNKTAKESFLAYREPTEWVQMPDLFPPQVPKEKKLEVIMSIISKSKEDFGEAMLDLQKWFEEFDSCYLLSFYAFYFMREKKGTTREHEGDFEHYQHYIEILQALALTKPRKIDVEPLLARADDLDKQFGRLGTLTQFKHMDITLDDTEESIKRKGTIAQVRNSTTAIRNWAYYFQMEKVTRSLMAKINKEFNAKYGVNADDIASAFFKIPQLINTKTVEHTKRLHEVFSKKDKQSVINAYENQFPEVVKITVENMDQLFNQVGRSVKRLKQALLIHSDLWLQDVYTFTLDELIHGVEGGDIDRESIRAIFDKLSYEFGDLATQNLDHIILDNPITKRPFIKLGKDTYFCPAAASLPHFAIEIMESIMSNDSKLTKKYSDEKSTYVEDYVRDILIANFPNATIYQNIKWRRSDIPQKEFETDNLLIAGSFALVLESKSGKLTPQGKRGAQDRLQKHVDELVLEPSRQANNFIDAVKRDKLSYVKDTAGRRLDIDFTDVKYFVPISITLENLGMLSNPREIVDAGMNKGMAPQDINSCMTMTDLECIFEILPYESMKLHYLVRRREFTMHIAYFGDEIDLLGFYLERGFNIGETEYNGSLVMNLTMVSANIDKYFMLVDDDERIDPPDNFLTSQWKLLLERLAQRKPEAWLEASFALLTCDNDDQKKFNAQAKKIIADVEKGNVSAYPKEPCMVFTTGAEKRKIAIVLYPYRNLSKEKRNDNIAYAMSEDSLKNCKVKLAFGIDLDQPRIPYSVMAVSKDSVLVEEPVEFIAYSPATSTTT